MRWSALGRARAHDAAARVPFTVGGVQAGSVARAHLRALHGAAGLRVDDGGVALDVPARERDARLAALNRELRREGLIRAWRDEPYLVVDPATLQPLACFERAASRFWGTLTFGAHCNGYVRDASGRPHALWIAQRAFDKATDPGLHDNLVGGGVPAGQSAWQTLVREGWEEAGLASQVMQRAEGGRVIELRRDIPEGLQHERIRVYDLELQPAERPANQDGEVHAFTLLPLPAALELAAGEAMTVDAALVTLDFALRRGLVRGDDAALAARFAALCVDAALCP